MTRPPLPPRLLRAASRQLEQEATLLLELQQLAALLTRDGVTGQALTEYQPELARIAERALEVRVERDALRGMVAAAWNCAPEEVRMGEIAADPSPLAQGMPARRSELLKLVAVTIGQLRGAQKSLAIWNGLVGSLLGVLFRGGGDSDRYNANGQRTLPAPHIPLSVRT